jgi:hypothetical protein
MGSGRKHRRWDIDLCATAKMGSEARIPKRFRCFGEHPALRIANTYVDYDRK